MANLIGFFSHKHTYTHRTDKLEIGSLKNREFSLKRALQDEVKLGEFGVIYLDFGRLDPLYQRCSYKL